MSGFQSIMTNPEMVWNAFSWMAWLTIKGGMILGLSLLVVTIFRRTSAARLHLILGAALTATLLLPILTYVFPEWRLPFTANLPAGFSAGHSVSQGSVTIASGSDPATSVPWYFWALAVWLLGSLSILGRAVSGLIVTSRIARQTQPALDASVAFLKEACRQQLDIRRPVELRISPRVVSPFVWGLLRPVVILPEAAVNWSRQDLRYVLIHEMAHIKRLDSVWLLISTFVAAVYWVNPLVWLTRKQLIIEAEKTCDDCVLISGTDVAAYAQHLLKVLDLLRKRHEPVPMVVGMARRSHMEGRLMSILSDRKRSAGLKRSALAIAIVLTMVFALPLAGMQVMAGDEKKAGEEQVLPNPDEFIKVDKPPQMVYQEPPVYPDSAKTAGVMGIVWIKALVDKKGDVIKALVDKSSGDGSLDAAALEAAYKNKFKPALQGENPVMVWLSYKVNFVLDDGATEPKKKQKGEG